VPQADYDCDYDKGRASPTDDGAAADDEGCAADPSDLTDGDGGDEEDEAAAGGALAPKATEVLQASPKLSKKERQRKGQARRHGSLASVARVDTNTWLSRQIGDIIHAVSLRQC
jgi:hypothetical protein